MAGLAFYIVPRKAKRFGEIKRQALPGLHNERKGINNMDKTCHMVG